MILTECIVLLCTLFLATAEPKSSNSIESTTKETDSATQNINETPAPDVVDPYNSCLCNGRGVCNQLNECHCNDGWAPPYCKGKGMGGSYSSNPAAIGPEPKKVKLGLIAGK